MLNSFKDGIPLIETSEIEARRIFSSEKTNLVQINLKAGAVIDTHTTEEDVIFYALEGNATINIAGDEAEISAGMYAECLGGIEKGLINTSTDIFKVLIVKMASYK